MLRAVANSGGPGSKGGVVQVNFYSAFVSQQYRDAQKAMQPEVEKAVQAILGAARTGKIGDGKIFLSRVDEAIRIRNDERGEGAL